MLGVTTVRRNGPAAGDQAIKADHPIMKGFPAIFKTPVIHEAYVIEKLWPDCVPLAPTYAVETAEGPTLHLGQPVWQGPHLRHHDRASQ